MHEEAGAPRALTASGTVPIASTRTSTPRDLSRLLVRCSISYKSAAIATAPGGLLASRLQATLAVPGLHPRPLARLDGGQHVRQIKWGCPKAGSCRFGDPGGDERRALSPQGSSDWTVPLRVLHRRAARVLGRARGCQHASGRVQLGGRFV